MQSFVLLATSATVLLAQVAGGRGAGSATGRELSGRRPLIIVDGVIVSDECAGLDGAAREPRVRIDNERVGSIAGLTTDEIEKAEILKGEAAAVYGPRAANGVLLITTKKGEHYCIDSSAGSLDDPFASHLFPPDLIMANQREIGLSADQRATIVNDLQRAQASFVELQWKMSTESTQLERLLEGPAVNESAVLAQLDRVLAAERDIKRAQIGLLIRIRNTLSPQQQATLTQLRRSRR
jgi:TonB-dependent SusC/RagA subfamily outer membrane receptor